MWSMENPIPSKIPNKNTSSNSIKVIECCKCKKVYKESTQTLNNTETILDYQKTENSMFQNTFTNAVMNGFKNANIPNQVKEKNPIDKPNLH